jgi:hypothetical protein
MPNIPTTYTDLPGYVAGQYDIQMVRLALAIADVLTAYGFSAGGGGGGGDASAENQVTEIARLESIRDRLPSTLGQKTGINSLSVVPASDAVFTAIGNGFASSATVQRAANTTAYTANDVFGASFEFANIAGAANQSIIITSIDIIFNITALPSGMGAFTLFLYSVTPPSAVVDNGAFSLPSGDRASCLTPGGIAIGSAALATGGGSVVLQADNLNLQFKPASTSLFGYLVTSASFTPAANSETATIRVRTLVV